MTLLKKGGLSLIVLSSIALIFTCIGAAGNAWVNREILKKNGDHWEIWGLWKHCQKDQKCDNFPATSDYLRSCRAMVIISSLFAFGALVLSIAEYFMDRIKLFYISIISVCAALAMFISVVIYISKNIWIDEPDFKYGWTFIMAWISIAFTLCEALLSLVLSRYHIA